MEEHGKRGRKLVLVPCPLQGHINPMLHLGSILRSKSFSITIAHTQFNFPNTSNHPSLTFLPLPDGLSEFDLSSNDFIALLTSLNVYCESPLQELLTKMIHEQDDHEKLPCIIYDEYMYFAESVAHCLKLPSILLSTCSAGHLVVCNEIPRLQENGFIPFKDDMPEELVPKLHPLRFKDLPIANCKNLDSLLKLIAAASDIRSSSAIILNTMDCIEKSSLRQLEKGFKVPIFPIGPLHKISPVSCNSLAEDEASCIAWLDRQNDSSVIYISLGSIASMDKKEVEQTAWGLATSSLPFLWVLRAESINLLPNDFLENVGERGYILKWAPQKEVLAHRAVGGFWSHCGWNSTIESLCEGIPMICRPCFGDQRVNARLVSHVWEVGFELEGDLERGVVEKAVKRLMVEKEGEVLRQRAADLQTKTSISSYNSLNKLNELIMSI